MKIDSTLPVCKLTGPDKDRQLSTTLEKSLASLTGLGFLRKGVFDKRLFATEERIQIRLEVPINESLTLDSLYHAITSYFLFREDTIWKERVEGASTTKPLIYSEEHFCTVLKDPNIKDHLINVSSEGWRSLLTSRLQELMIVCSDPKAVIATGKPTTLAGADVYSDMFRSPESKVLKDEIIMLPKDFVSYFSTGLSFELGDGTIHIKETVCVRCSSENNVMLHYIIR